MCSVLGTVKSNIQNNGGTLLSFSRPYGRRTRRSVIKSHIYQYNPNKDVAIPKDNKKTNTLHQPTSKKQWYMLILKGVGIKSQNQKPCTPPYQNKTYNKNTLFNYNTPLIKKNTPHPLSRGGRPMLFGWRCCWGFVFYACVPCFIGRLLVVVVSCLLLRWVRVLRFVSFLAFLACFRCVGWLGLFPLLYCIAGGLVAIGCGFICCYVGGVLLGGIVLT